MIRLALQSIGFIIEMALLMLGRWLEPKPPAGALKRWLVRKVGPVDG